MCVAYLHMPLRDFWDSTPIEIDYALKAYYESKAQEAQLTWEQTRTQIYFNYLMTPSHKRKVSYSSFKKEFLPFGFDIENEEPKQVITDEDFAAMQNFINKKLKGPQN